MLVKRERGQLGASLVIKTSWPRGEQGERESGAVQLRPWQL